MTYVGFLRGVDDRSLMCKICTIHGCTSHLWQDGLACLTFLTLPWLHTDCSLKLGSAHMLWVRGTPLPICPRSRSVRCMRQHCSKEVSSLYGCSCF